MDNEDDLYFTSESPAQKRYERALKDDSLVDEVEMDWWVKLLQERPDLIRKCDFSKHNGYEGAACRNTLGQLEVFKNERRFLICFFHNVYPFFFIRKWARERMRAYRRPL